MMPASQLSRTVSLAELLSGLVDVPLKNNPKVTGLCLDSRSL